MPPSLRIQTRNEQPWIDSISTVINWRKRGYNTRDQLLELQRLYRQLTSSCWGAQKLYYILSDKSFRICGFRVLFRANFLLYQPSSLLLPAGSDIAIQPRVIVQRRVDLSVVGPKWSLHGRTYRFSLNKLGFDPILIVSNGDAALVRLACQHHPMLPSENFEVVQYAAAARAALFASPRRG